MDKTTKKRPNKYCGKCKQLKPKSEFGRNKATKDGLNCWCRGCKNLYEKKHSKTEQGKATSKAYRERNKAAILASAKKYRDTHKGLIAKKQREYWLKNRELYKKAHKKHHRLNKERINKKKREKKARLRREVLSHYGGRCTCCGETEFLFLSIDHINNDGSEHRRKLGSPSSDTMYRWLRDNKFPAEFQVLCRNCNYGKYRNNGICPHKEQSRKKII